MKYLLLGGAGFIGTHLAKRLLKDEHTVTIIDSCITSSKPNYDVDFINADLTTYNINDLDVLISKYDIVYFLAGSVGVSNIVNNPKSTVRNNLGLTLRLIPLFEKLLYLSYQRCDVNPRLARLNTLGVLQLCL